ncbi:MAG TPA: calcium/proton exchanger [Candidatus Paceibacterota bacterium]|jgi:Ca2+:H+ antiporter|nr:calcium/proton exchanger [Candidatus Paceibacterota bacterium]
MNKLFLGLLLFVPITVLAYTAGVAPTALFFLSALAIVPLAKYIGEATEELAGRTNPALGGLLNATFGNATELIIGIFALRAGLIEVVKASITGSIVGNLLLVLGTAILFGGWKKNKQTFNATAAKAAGSTLLLAIIALVMPAIFVQSSGAVSPMVVERLSVIVSIIMILAYLANLWFTLHTHKHLYEEEVTKYEPKWSVSKSVMILFAATIAVAYMSELLVGAIEPLVLAWGWSEIFIGVIFIAIIGNAAEHASAITVALKNRMDLALQISIGSAIQIAMFAAPMLVLSSFFFTTHMPLVFNTFELAAIILSVFIVNAVAEDGESNWFEGVQLLAAYAIIAVAFFFHP